MISESVVRDKNQLDLMFEISYHEEIMPCLRMESIDPGTEHIQYNSDIVIL